MVVVVVAFIPMCGISSLPRKTAVFFLSHAVRFHIFTFPGPVHFCAVKEKEKEAVFFWCLRERGLKTCKETVNYSDLKGETGCPYIKLNLRTY